MESQNKFNRQSTQVIKHKGLYDDIKRRSFESMVGHTTQSGLIVKSKSRYTALCFYIPKKDSFLWLVQDYRKLNQVTIKDKTPLPLIGEVIDKLKEARYFNKLDQSWGYNNIQIKEEDK